MNKKWIICPDCDGDGTHVHDAITVQSRESFDEAGGEFEEAYFRGDYDVLCKMCRGTGKVREDADLTPRRQITNGPLRNEAGEPLEMM